MTSQGAVERMIAIALIPATKVTAQSAPSPAFADSDDDDVSAFVEWQRPPPESTKVEFVLFEPRFQSLGDSRTPLTQSDAEYWTELSTVVEIARANYRPQTTKSPQRWLWGS